MNDWPKYEFPWLGIDIGVEGGVSSLGWGGEKAFHRGTTQEQFVEFFIREKRYKFDKLGKYAGLAA
jgi:hypothetical protein